MTNKNEYSAIDLLDKVLEFIEMTPEKSKWSETALKSNPPRHIRLWQIEFLLNAFLTFDSKSSFNKNIKSFLSGDFIRQKDLSDYAQTIEFIKAFVKNSKIDFEDTREIDIKELVFIFPMLVDYKKRLRSILLFNSGWIAASSTIAQFSIQLTNSISKNIVDKYDTLDKSLELFINPKGLTFTEDELISKFNYPTENLDDINFDFI